MVFARELTNEEIKALRSTIRRDVGRISIRAQIVLFSAKQRLSANEIATLLEMTPATIRLWISRFNEAGISGLRDVTRPGRPRKQTAHQYNQQ